MSVRTTNILNKLSTEEKTKFLKIKDIFDKPEDRTIYLRLLYIIITNLKTKKIDLEDLFDEILFLKSNYNKEIYDLINEELNIFMNNTNYNTSQSKYIVSGNTIYAIPNESSNTYNTKKTSGDNKNTTMSVKKHKTLSNNVYSTIKDDFFSNENYYENPDKLLEQVIKQMNTNSIRKLKPLSSIKVLQPRPKQKILEINLNNVIDTPGVREFNLNNVIRDVERQIAVGSESKILGRPPQSTLVGGTRKRKLRKLKRTTRTKN